MTITPNLSSLHVSGRDPYHGDIPNNRIPAFPAGMKITPDLSSLHVSGRDPYHGDIPNNRIPAFLAGITIIIRHPN
jgi:hypothetical protein